MKSYKYTNQLIHETSPYLLQHAHNPVNWMAWNTTTLELAKKENKLLLISIGYSACHWCHVMEQESFEDEEVAAIMNQNFINVKIDREERPDIDQIYMSAVQLITGRGGWPLNCIAMPNGKPIWGGTYFSKNKWINALKQLADLHKQKPEELVNYANKLTLGVQKAGVFIEENIKENLNFDIVKNAVANWLPQLDFDFGGNNGAPKFPLPNNLLFLLRYGFQTNTKEVNSYVNTTLTKMAYGGIFDPIGGGFSRYSVDKKWHIPHFEKMLYDNGQLISLYAQAYKASKKKQYKNVVYETIHFIKNELLGEKGNFYASLDADSLNQNNQLKEGAYYVWTKKELENLLKNDFSLFKAYYNINSYGFWENNNYVLIKNKSNSDFCKEFNISKTELSKKVSLWKNILYKNRQKRTPPRLDDKSLTSWNALLLKGLTDAYKAFNEEEFLNLAIKNATFIQNILIQPEGNLYRNYKNNTASINGFLIDYATTVDAFISVYEITLNEKWLYTAKQLTDYVFSHFYDEKSGYFYFTSDIDTALIAKKIELEDNVIPASNSIMASNLFKLGYIFSNSYYLKTSKNMLLKVVSNIEKYPSSYSNWLLLAMNFTTNHYEVAICSAKALKTTAKLHKKYLPNILVVGTNKLSNLPLLKGRYNTSKTQIYVCIKGTCQLPVASLKEVQLKINVKI